MSFPEHRGSDLEKQTKILVVGPYPPPFAGPEMAIKMLLESPLRAEFQLQHLSTNVRKINKYKGRVGLTMFRSFFQFFSRLIWSLSRFRPAIVYYFVTATRLGWLGRDVWCIAISRLFGAKVVIHMRGGHFRHRLATANRFEVAIIRWACQRVSWSLVQAPSLTDQFEGLVPSERIKVVPNMIDVNRYAAVPVEEHEFGRILFLGHLSVAKGYCELLKIIPEVANRFPDVSFQFAGTKLDKERNVFHIQSTGKPLPNEDPETCYQSNIEGRFEANYTYLGMLDEEAKIAAIRSCDFLVLPSFSEGFSMAILEAMSMGKPVVCAAVGAMRDFVVTGEHGEVIEPGDTKALASAIIKLLSDRNFRDRVATVNSGYVRQNFTQAIIAEKLGQLFREALV